MKYVYMFEEGDADMKDLLGGKGANLAEMTRIGLPVPPGFTITTDACRYYIAHEGFPEGIWSEIQNAMKVLEKRTEKTFGSAENPLLVSVRSGARISMPGMMDTILNLGLNDVTVKGLASRSGDLRFALDTYRRFVQMFGDVVLGVDHDEFEAILQGVKEEVGISEDDLLGPEALRRVIELYKRLLRDHDVCLPHDPMEQLEMAIVAVFRSWENPRARTYRKMNGIPDDLGTAVNVQAMVFGNMGPYSATGVGFTRNPATGEKEYYGEYLVNAQGEDLVAGIRTPKPIKEMEREMPEVFEQLKQVYQTLERHFKDMQDFEFTVEEGRLYVLQTRTGKRTAHAAVKIAVDMVHEGFIDKETALLRIDPDQLEALLHRQIDPMADYRVLATGLPASPGAATGRVVFSADDAVRLAERGEEIILVRRETKPDDIHGFYASGGILTAFGGMTCHAAIVARAIGKPCVVGCDELNIDYDTREFRIGDEVYGEGTVITLDGTTGRVILGTVPMIDPEMTKELSIFLSWADEARELAVMANADTPETAEIALRFGAEGIGLCRTERMFNSVGRLPLVRAMILAENDDDRKKVLDKLARMQKEDFKAIFRIMNGKPVTIRLLDPPLHEFLPSVEEVEEEIHRFQILQMQRPERKEEIDAIVEEKRVLLRKVINLREVNPMLGHRGVRLGLTYPEIYEMQIRAICSAATELKQEGLDPRVEIMVPQVCTAEEIRKVRRILEGVLHDLDAGDLEVKFGSMIEVVRACLVADEIAEVAEFFSFGTNDLTQATFSFSREDAESKFLPFYVEKGLISHDPFRSLDESGVVELMRIAISKGRSVRDDLKIGICGEHGGDPRSIALVHDLGLDYVSCSPYRVPLARLASAQSALMRRANVSRS